MKSVWSNMKIATKVVATIAALLVVSFLVNFYIVQNGIRDRAMEAMLMRSRAITGLADNARAYVADLRVKYKVFDEDRIWRPENVKDQLYYTLPIVAGWEAAKRGAEKVGYSFRAPSLNPRNPDNAPTPIEREMLLEMRAKGLDEVWRVDEEANSLRYMKPVKLTQDCMVCHGDKSDDVDGDGIDPFGYRMEGMSVGEYRGAYEIISDLKPIQGQIRASMMSGLITVGIFIAVAIAVTRFLMSSVVAKPIARAVRVVEALANKDLTARMEIHSSDEMGQLSRAIDQMANDVNAALGEVLTSSNSVAAATDQITASSHDVRQGTTKQEKAVTETSAAMQEMNATIEINTRNAVDMAASVTETSATIEEMTASIHQVAENVKRAADLTTEAMSSVSEGNEVTEATVARIDELYRKVSESARQIESLGVRSEEIGNVISVINSIADQTNLLALNAAIIAAQAGEHGKGF
ncbi:MAG: methyl-accepting chemotaxis protein, partial [Myxococcales bacterium]|nr:methyl-accepting chemotaxis protein [Myxococcales bacterium]